tara:strand:- start:922 stop:3321 length:2400 start_codon:yes stop_codon:yes gene_type:complete
MKSHILINPLNLILEQELYNIPQIEGLEKYLKLLKKKEKEGDEFPAEDAIEMQVLRRGVLRDLEIQGKEIEEIEKLIQQEREKLEKDSSEKPVAGSDEEEEKEQDTDDPEVDVTDVQKALLKQYSQQSDIVKELREIQNNENYAIEIRDAAKNVADIVQAKNTDEAIAELISKFGPSLIGLDPARPLTPEPFATLFTILSRNVMTVFQPKGYVPSKEEAEGYRTAGEYMARGFAINVALIAQAKVRRVALMKNLGPNSKFVELGGKARNADDIAKIIRNSTLMGPWRNPWEWIKGGVAKFRSDDPDSWRKNLGLTKEEFFDQTIAKELDSTSNLMANKDSIGGKFKRRIMNPIADVFVTTITGQRVSGALYRQLATTAAALGLGTAERAIYIDRLEALLKASLSADNYKKFKDELAAKINDKNLRNVSTRDKIMQVFEDGRYINKLGKGRDDGNAFVKAIQEADQTYAERSRKLLKTVLLSAKKYVQNNTGPFLKWLGSQMGKGGGWLGSQLLKGGGKLVPDSAKNFRKNFQNELLLMSDPIYKGAMEAKKRGDQFMPMFPYSTRPITPDEAIRRRRATFGARGGLAVQSAAKATAEMKAAIAKLKSLVRLREQNEDNKESTNVDISDFETILAPLEKALKQETSELEKEEKEYDNVVSTVLGVENDVDMEEIYNLIIKQELDSVIQDLNVDEIVDSSISEMEAALDSSLQKFAQRINGQINPKDGTRDEEPQSTLDGTQDLQPQSTELQEGKIKITKSKLIDLISEQVKEKTQTVDVTKDQLVTLVAQEAFKQINRKK